VAKPRHLGTASSIQISWASLLPPPPDTLPSWARRQVSAAWANLEGWAARRSSASLPASQKWRKRFQYSMVGHTKSTLSTMAFHQFWKESMERLWRKLSQWTRTRDAHTDRSRWVSAQEVISPRFLNSNTTLVFSMISKTKWTLSKINWVVTSRRKSLRTLLATLTISMTNLWLVTVFNTGQAEAPPATCQTMEKT